MHTSGPIPISEMGGQASLMVMDGRLIWGMCMLTSIGELQILDDWWCG